MTTETHDYATDVGQLIITYEANKNRIEYLRKRIGDKSQDLAAFSLLIETKPEDVQPVGDYFISRYNFLPTGVSCDMLKELAEEINELRNLLDQQYKSERSMRQKGMGRYISEA